jgi:hypothetical protein
MRRYLIIILAAVLTIVGVVSMFMTFSVIFDLFDIRKQEGNYIPMVVYGNFICSFLYLIAAWYIYKENDLSTIYLIFSVLLLLVTYAFMLYHIQSGRPYEMRTVFAMLGRTSLTIVYAAIAWYLFSRVRKLKPPSYIDEKSLGKRNGRV